MAHKPEYVITDASIYTTNPVVTEHRYRLIKETKPPESELNGFERFLCVVIGIPLGVWLFFTIGGWLFRITH